MKQWQDCEYSQVWPDEIGQMTQCGAKTTLILDSNSQVAFWPCSKIWQEK